MEFLLAWMLIASVQLVATMSPGPAFVMAVRYCVSYGRKASVFLALGLGFGIAVHVVFALAGLSFIIAQSVFLYNLIKYMGAAYLVYIGIKGLRSMKSKKRQDAASQADHNQKPISSGKAIVTGFLTNVLNPKAVVFFTAVFSQFIGVDTSFSLVLLYGLTSVAIEILWFIGLAIILTNSSVKKRFMGFIHWVEGVCGGLMIALGVKLVLSK
ncbi:MAG: LysE family translocator [Alphaproteobacteria bacterium]